MLLFPSWKINQDNFPFKYSYSQFDALATEINSERDLYVRGHLVNNHLHGPNTDWNLKPITRTMNSSMSADIEENAKKAVGDPRNIMFYETKIHGYHDGPIDKEGAFPKKLEVSWGYLTKDGKLGGEMDEKGKRVYVDSKTYTQGPPTKLFGINDMGLRNLKSEFKKLSIPETLANLINNTKKMGFELYSYNDLKEAVEIYLEEKKQGFRYPNYESSLAILEQKIIDKKIKI